MRSLVLVLAALLLGLAPVVHAEIENVFVDASGGGRVERWWPKIAPPKGWHHDRDNSFNYNLNAVAPEGESFGSADVVLYAKAIRKAREEGVSTLEQFMARERERFLKKQRDYDIKPARGLTGRDQTAWKSATFTPRKDGNWERVFYSEDGDHWLIFVISARSKELYRKQMPTFERWVRQYRRSA
jgi:hypothetical protein